MGHGSDAIKAASEGVVVVSWDGIPGLANSRVTRDMLIRLVDVDDHVEATADMEYTLRHDLEPSTQLEVADLVRATQDLGNVRKGTYGTIVAVSQESGGEFSNHVASDLQVGRAIVRFANQLDTVKVWEGHIQKAPQVGNHVRARVDLGGSVAGEGTVLQGSVGSVVAVTPAEDGLSFRFTVEWNGHHRSKASGEQLETLTPPDGSLVHEGTKGIVIGSMSDHKLIIDWHGFRGPGAVVDRGHVKKSEEWSAHKQEWCCDRGMHCSIGSGSNGGGGSAAMPTSTSSARLFKCRQGQSQDWSVEKATWCCEHEGVGCAVPSASTSSSPAVPALRQHHVPVSFDPAPRAYISTSRPALADTS